MEGDEEEGEEQVPDCCKKFACYPCAMCVQYLLFALKDACPGARAVGHGWLCGMAK